jgi:hypothetical protein
VAGAVRAGEGCGHLFGNRAAAMTRLGVTTARPHPITSPILVGGAGVKGERCESAGLSAARPWTPGTETKHSNSGEAEHPATDQTQASSDQSKEDDHGKALDGR